MRTCRRVLPILLLCLCSLAASGQQNWQGTAAVARSGEFDAAGLFAASNAFAENTKIQVQNAQTGQSVQVTVTQRIQGAASVFLLLSEEAGKQIGLSGSQVIRVRASVVSTLGTDLSGSLQEEAYSSDPDLNPALSIGEQQLRSDTAGPEVPTELEEPAAVEEQTVEVARAAPSESEQAVEPGTEAVAEEALPAAEQQGPPTEMAEAAAAEEQPPAEPSPEELPEEETVEIAEAPAFTPETAEPTPEEKRLQELTDRIPQKQLYMPPRQQEVYALAPEPPAEEVVEEEIAAAEQPAEEVSEVEEIPEEPAEVEEEVEAVAEPEVAEAEEEPAETTEIVEEGPPEVSMPGPEAEEQPLEVALPGPEAAEPEKPSPEGTRLPAPEEQPPLTMAPEEPPTGEIEETAITEEVVEQPAEELAAVEEEQPAFEEPVAEAVEEETAAEVAMAEAPAEEQIALSESLPSRTYFVQLGAYSTRNLAEKLAWDLTQSYSVTILPASSGGRLFYKVLVGPLNVDESGTLLYQFRSSGFKDAFIQYVE